MTSIAVDFVNGTRVPITNVTVQLDGLVPISGPYGTIAPVSVIESGKSLRQTSSIEPVPADGLALSGRQNISDLYRITMQYTLEGARWKRVGTARPTRVGA